MRPSPAETTARLPLPELYSRVERHVPRIEWPILAEDIAAILKLKSETQRRHPGAQLPDAGDLPQRRRHRRRLPGAGPRGGAHRRRRHRAGRRALHGRDREDAESRKDRADPGPEGRLLARRVDHGGRRAAAARAPSRRADRDLRQHLGRGEGRERHLLHLGQREEDRRGAGRAEASSCSRTSTSRATSRPRPRSRSSPGRAIARCTSASPPEDIRSAAREPSRRHRAGASGMPARGGRRSATSPARPRRWPIMSAKSGRRGWCC